MAGRGVDITLGEGVRDLGGLAVVGTERHESRRIDNQLRGRAGRQGDPGSTRFYLSLEDELMKRFVGPTVAKMLERFGLEGDEPLEHRWVTRTIEQAQTKVEGMNFDYRKHLVEYDDVLAKQREIVYEDRNRILRGEDVRDIMMDLIHDELREQVSTHCPGPHADEWDTTALYNAISTIMPMPRDVRPEDFEQYAQEELVDVLAQIADEGYAERERALGNEVVRAWERRVLLVTMSGLWIHHVDAMDELRENALLAAYAQQDPLVKYKRDAFEMFQEFQVIFRKNVVYQIYHVLFQPTAPLILEETGIAVEQKPRAAVAAGAGAGVEKTARQASQHSKRDGGRATRARAGGKIGRNDPCYCGSGKKYKFCHGRA
jgi:preprotein translocase subunit SecA